MLWDGEASRKIKLAFQERDLVFLLHFHWGGSSVGRASRSQRGGQGFESPSLHHPFGDVPIIRPRPCASAFCFIVLGLQKVCKDGRCKNGCRGRSLLAPKNVQNGSVLRGIVSEMGTPSPSGRFPLYYIALLVIYTTFPKNEPKGLTFWFEGEHRGRTRKKFNYFHFLCNKSPTSFFNRGCVIDCKRKVTYDGY